MIPNNVNIFLFFFIIERAKKMIDPTIVDALIITAPMIGIKGINEGTA